MEDPDQKLLDSFPTPAFIVDVPRDGPQTFLHVNPAHTAVSGLRPEDVAGKTALELFGEKGGRFVWDRQRRAIETGASQIYRVVLPFQTGNHTMLTTLVPMLDEDGRTFRLIGTMIDASNADEYNRLVDLRDEAERRAMRDAEHFIAMAAHDLRSPMRAVSQLALALKEEIEAPDEEVAELLDLLENVGKRALALTSEVLELSRATEGRDDRRAFNLQSVVRDIFSTLDPRGVHCIDCASVALECDETVAKIVLRNLLDNALKYAGKDRVEIGISADEPVHGLIALQIEDNGKGFDEASIAFLSGGEYRQGSGFGLLGIRRILAARGGSIEVGTSDLGGARISITIPGSVHVALPLARSA